MVVDAEEGVDLDTFEPEQGRLIRCHATDPGSGKPLPRPAAFHRFGPPPSRVRPRARANQSSGAITRLTMAITLIRMFIEGPEVSLKGSPTVSPTTVAVWVSEPLPP